MKHKKSNWEKLIIIKIMNKNLYSGECRKVQIDYVDVTDGRSPDNVVLTSEVHQ